VPLALGLIGAASIAPAQSGTTLLSDAALGYSYSSKAGLNRGGKVGDVAIQHYDFEWNTKTPLTASSTLLTGLSCRRDSLDLSAGVPLPNRLESVGLSVGVNDRFAPGWSFTGLLRPNLSGDALDLSGPNLNVAAIASVGCEASKDFSWSAGVAAALRSRYHVLPIGGARWRFSPDWTFAVGFPETGVAFKASDALTVKAGARIQGGDYRMTKARAPGLGDTYLEYREIRLGGGFEYTVEDHLSLEFDGGAVLNRRFDYYDRDYRLNGSSAAYLRVSARIRF